MNLFPPVLRCVSLREVRNNLVLFQDVFLIAVSWNVCRAEGLPKILISSPLVLITVSHLRYFSVWKMGGQAKSRNRAVVLKIL
jgi:hypothetical protein